MVPGKYLFMDITNQIKYVNWDNGILNIVSVYPSLQAELGIPQQPKDNLKLGSKD